MPTLPSTPAENLLKTAVEAQFSTRPSLRSVVAQMLADTLKVKYPPLSILPSGLCLALPREGGGRGLHPLLDVALQHLADRTFPDLSFRYGLDAFLSDTTGTRLTFEANGEQHYDLRVFESVIRELPSILFVGAQEALAAYWGQDSNAGGSRWQWLAGVLRDSVRTSAIRQSGDDTEQLQILTTLVNNPARESRTRLPWPDNAIHAYTLEARLVHEATTLTVQSGDILVVSGHRVVWCSLSGQIESYASLDTFSQAWREHLERQFIADKITWNQYEPDGDIFEVQAALVLNQQLDDLAALPFPAGTGVADMERLFMSVTNPARVFSRTPPAAEQTLGPIRDTLPDWLLGASPADRFAYRQCLLEQASHRRLSQGKAYLDGLEDIRSYTASHLNHQLCLDRNADLHGNRTCQDLASSPYNAEELELTFHVPVGTLAGGYVQPVSMSLIDLALKNLSGRPNGRMTLRHTGDQHIEEWLTPEYVLQLIQRVDIGQNYPAYIQQALLSDTPEAENRKRLYGGQKPIQLKTQALEHKIKGQAGLTLRGFRYVKAVLGSHRAERWVGSDEIVMRPLAFLHKPGAQAVAVQNMFIIESRDAQAGPHLLYRPAYDQSLLEFATRDRLLSAIAQPGALQESVLAWLPDRARVIYSNGGFIEPHYVRMHGIGSEFDPLPSVPKPATLAGIDNELNEPIQQALNNDQLMDYLFACEAQQLLAQADRESTSNAESRWALILEGAQLGFNTLLMLVRGPLAVVGWLIQLAQGLNQDLPALESDDPIAKELAWVDLLLNIGMILIHHGLPADSAHTARGDEHLVRLPLRRPADTATSRPSTISRGKIGLPSEPPGGGRTLLDFDRSLASDSASARLLEKLLEVNVPWPSPAPEPLTHGPFKGLFKVDNVWHASVGGLFFQARVVPDLGEVSIVHPDKPDHPGIKLKSNSDGHWTLDRGLKLLGGGPKRIAEIREASRREGVQLESRCEELNINSMRSVSALQATRREMKALRKALIPEISRLKQVWGRLQTATDAQRPIIEALHERVMRDYSAIRTRYEVTLERLENNYEISLPLRIELFKALQQLDRHSGARGQHIETLDILWNDQLNVQIHLQMWVETLQFTDQGELMRHLAQRMLPELQQGRPWTYQEHVSRSIDLAAVIRRKAARSREMETTLELLAQDSAAGRAKRERLLADIRIPQYFFSENLELHALIPLSWVVVRLPALDPSPLETLYTQHLAESKLEQALLSHTEVRSSSGYPLDDQHMLYTTLLDKYRSYERAVEALTFINPERVHPTAEQLLSGLRHARRLAENELETVVRSQEALEVEAPAIARKPKEPTKRIFKTNRRKYLIGDMRPADALHPQGQLIISNTSTGGTTTSFTPFDADSWIETVQAPAALPELVPPVRPLAELRRQGEQLIQQYPEIKRVIAAQQQQLESPTTRQNVNPADWNEMLTGQAGKLTELADTLGREHPDRPSTQGLIDTYRANARDMQGMAKRVCSEAYKRQLPTLESLDYLWQQQEIDINLTSRADPQRPTLGGDFFTEYAVYDKAQRPPTVLWYAHFHYAAADAPPARYTRAHLKLASQRKYTQKDLLKEHVQVRLHSQQEPGADPIEKILYVLITPPQDQLFLAIAPATT